MRSLALVAFAALAAQWLPAQPDASEMLAQALRTNDLRTIDHLLSSGLDPNRPDRHGQTPLYSAILFNNARGVELLLGWHADPNLALMRRESNQFSAVPIQYAAREGNLRIARALLSAGARINDAGMTGRTALHYAVEGYQLDMMKLLLDKGADVNARDEQGASPLDDAVWRGCLDCTAILLARGAQLNDVDTLTGATPVNEAAFRGDERMLGYLLRFRPDVSVPDKKGRGPLENAVRMRYELAALLLLDAQPKESQTPDSLARILDAAILRDEAGVVAALADRGAAVNAPLPSGLTPLDAAASAGAVNVAKILLDRGADANQVTSAEATPLEDAALKGFDAIVALLLDHGAQVDHINPDSGTTALYAAASFGNTDVVKRLLDRAADPALCGRNGKTAYQAAVENGHEVVAALLRNHGGASSCKR